MRIVNVFVGILFAAACAHAQIPLYPYLYSQPYVYTAPDPFAQPYSGPYYFLPPSSAAMQFAVQNSNSNLVNLYRQPVQVRSEIEELRKEPPTPQIEARQFPPPAVRPSEPPAMPIVLVFNNGQRVESRGYVIEGASLWYFTATGREKVDLSTLNVSETQNENRRRGIDFPSPRSR